VAAALQVLLTVIARAGNAVVTLSVVLTRPAEGGISSVYPDIEAAFFVGCRAGRTGFRPGIATKRAGHGATATAEPCQREQQEEQDEQGQREPKQPQCQGHTPNEPSAKARGK
jgi:hypothetical protein